MKRHPRQDQDLKGRILARVHADELSLSIGEGQMEKTRPGGGFPDQIWVEDPSGKLVEDGS